MQNRDSEYKKTRSPKKYWMEGVYYMNGWSPFLNHLKEYYKSHDKFRSLVDDDNGEGLSLKNYYVNLALVTEAHHESVVSHVQESSLKREERYQDMLLSGRTLGVNELFDNLDSRLDSAGWISITGRAGAGKTTLLQYIAYRWGGVREGLWHNRFDFVFRVQLNLLKNDKYKHHSYEQILSKLIYESFAKTEHYADVLSEEAIYRSIVEKKFRNRTLLLLDGFDEIQGLYNDEHKHVKDFIDRVMGQFPNGVMATRPDALPKAWQLEQPSRFKKQYENVGFTVDDVYQYVDKYFKEDERAHKESLLAALDANPEMMSLAQIPINTHILCLTWKSREESVSDSQDSAHFTMTQLYQRLLIWLLKRYCKKFKSITEKNPERLLAICETELSTLSTIAYTAFVDKKIQFLEGEFVKQHVKSSTFMEVLSKEFGVLRAFNEREDGYADYFYFVHLTYQEFFAALYIAKQLSVKPKDNREEEIERRKNIQSIVKTIVDNRDNPQYDVIWIFLSGLLSMSDYQIGADYFWDAIIEFPAEDVEAVTFHPHIHILKSKQRICREAFLTLRHDPSLVIPPRLSILKTHFQNLHLWQGVQQTEALVQTWHDDHHHSVAARVYQNTQKQYQTDTVVLGLQTEILFSLDAFLMSIPSFKQSVLDGCKSSNPEDRRDAAYVLGKLGVKDPEVIEALRSMLTDSEACVRSAAAALDQLGDKDPDVIEALRNMLKNSEACVLSSAAALGKLGDKDPDLIAVLRNALTHEDYCVRRAADDALGKLGVKDPDVIEALRNALKDSKYSVRRDAAAALGKLGVKDPEVVIALRNALKDRDDVVRRDTAYALGQLGVKDPEVIIALRNTLKDRDSGVRRDAAEALGELGVKDPDVVIALRNALKDRDDEVRGFAAHALGQLGVKDPDVVIALRNTLTDREYWIRRAAANALGQLGVKDPEVVAVFRNALTDREYWIRRTAAYALGQLDVKDPDVIEALRNDLKDRDDRVRRDAAYALGKLGVKDADVIEVLRNMLKDRDDQVRRTAADVLGKLGVKDSKMIQYLRDLLQNTEVWVRSATIRALKHAQGLTIDICVERLENETHFEVIGEIYEALLRINPYDYLPYLVNHAHPDLPYLFVAASYFQGVMILQKEGQLYLGETLLDSDEEVVQRILVAKALFIERMGGYTECLNAMKIAIHAPKITAVFSEDFLNSNLPVDLSYDMEQRVRHIDESVRVLSYRVEALGQDVMSIRAEFNRIQKSMESEWQRVQDILPSDDVAYIKKFKQQLVQMYIVATVATSGDVQMCLAGTAGTVVTVLDVIAGLVPWGGGAVQLLSYLTQAIGEKVKQNRMERVLHLGSTPEDVAILATHLGRRLLHCLELEHYARDGRIHRLLNSLGNMVGGYAETGFYGALFEAFTESSIVSVITHRIVETMTPPDVEARASQDVQILLSAIMEKSVPHTLENQIDLDRLFLYSAPLLTVIDRIFMSMVAQYCAQRGYSLEAISKVKHKTEFCAKFAEECHKRASSTAGYIEDLSKRDRFIEQMATECNRRNLLRPSKELANWGFLGKKDRSMTLSIDQDALKTGSKILEDVLTNIRNR